jgi:hypothetical protein
MGPAATRYGESSRVVLRAAVPRNKYEASSRRIMTMTAGSATRSANIRVINRRA